MPNVALQSVMQKVTARMQPQMHDQPSAAAAPSRTVAPSPAAAIAAAGEQHTASARSGSPAAPAAGEAAQAVARVSVFSRLGGVSAAVGAETGASDSNRGSDGGSDAADSGKARASKPTRAGFGVYTPPTRHPAGRGEDGGHNSKAHPYDRAAGPGTHASAHNSRYLDR